MKIAAYVMGLVVAFCAGVALMMFVLLVVENVVYVREDENHGS